MLRKIMLLAVAAGLAKLYRDRSAPGRVATPVDKDALRSWRADGSTPSRPAG